MNLRLILIVAAAATGFLVAGCGTSGNFRNDAEHKALLETLRQCLVAIPVSGQKNRDFTSPCVGKDVSSLNGISRGRLSDALGPPRFCISATDTSFPDKETCPSTLNPIWSFYRLADPMSMGGGPELVCVADGGMKCTTLEWRRSK
ncbi:MAG: hypothetical protein JSS29_10955 [Proteobacteria bacterium]|nr:hypothetical protein [Pseudomonadota bacterium]